MNDFIQKNIITIWIAAFVFEILMGMLAQSIAEKKGHTKRWFWAGFFLSLVGVAWAAGLPDEIVRRHLNISAKQPERGEQPYGGTVQPGMQPSASREADDGELAAVLSAAVAAMGEEEGRKFVMRSFRPVGEGSTAWNRAGRGKAVNTRR
jgi:hypothetical protein